MTERRFDDAEVSAIFARAADRSAANPEVAAREEGMTLAQLQEIGREVGISPAAIASAALAVRQGDTDTETRVLGLPVSVGHTISLGRRLSSEEWERVVVLLRETFNARGKTASEGSLRQWTNGNLQVLLEPTTEGDRLRMRTTKTNAKASLLLNSILVGTSVLAGLVASQAAVAPPIVASFTALGAVGAAMMAYRAWQLPAWAKARREQMRAIADRVLTGE